MSAGPFLIRLPDGYEPWKHGWVRNEGNSRGEMVAWQRWEIPYRFRAVLMTGVMHDEETGAEAAFYTGPVAGEFPEQARAGDVWRELARTDLNDFNQELVR